MKNIARAAFITIMVSACGGSGGGSGGDQGTLTSPVALGDYPITAYSGSVGVATSIESGSYYKVDAIAPGGSYNVSLTNSTGAVFLYAYDNSSFTTGWLCNDGANIAADLACTASAVSGPSLYIQVINNDITDVSYTLTVE